jgi:gas vesicle protein GvpL/GvpF
VGLLLYAITTPATSDPGGAIVRVQAGGLTAWATPIGEEPPPFTREDVLHHHGVVRDVFERVEACLPARFPTVVGDAAVLRGELESHAAELTERLEAVRGAAEMAVTAVWTTVEAPQVVDAATPGRRYLLERRAALTASERQHAEAEHLADELEKVCGAALRRAERHVCPSPQVALSLALLVERGTAEDTRKVLGQQMRPGVRILVHGPWPPYTFAQRRDGGAET